MAEGEPPWGVLGLADRTPLRIAEKSDEYGFEAGQANDVSVDLDVLSVASEDAMILRVEMAGMPDLPAAFIVTDQPDAALSGPRLDKDTFPAPWAWTSGATSVVRWRCGGPHRGAGVSRRQPRRRCPPTRTERDVSGAPDR